MRNSVNNTGGVTFDQIFRAIGDPHRLKILALLREKELSAGEILKALDVVQSTLSHHMKNLVDAGIVTASRHGKWTYYSLNTDILSDAVRFLEEYAEGTKIQAGFAVKEKNNRPEAPVSKETENSISLKRKSPAEKEEHTGISEEKEGKKKSKKGKKGKKNKK